MFDIPNGERIGSDLNRLFSEIRYGRKKAEHYLQQAIRASSFPICPRAYHIYKRTPLEKRPLDEDAFVRDSTAIMGTGLHLALQKWFGIQGYLYGNWVCVRCKKIKRHKTGAQRCKKCGRPMIYHEYAVKKNKKTPFTGHIDGILKMPSGEVFLIDFKGSSQQAIRQIKESGKPKETHYLQVNAYANALNTGTQDVGDLGQISKIIIIYVDRGAPHRLWHPVQVAVSERVYRDTISRIRVAKRSLKNMEIPRGLCVTPSDTYAKYCPWKTLCFSPALEGLLSDKVEPESPRAYASENELLLLASYLESH